MIEHQPPRDFTVKNFIKLNRLFIRHFEIREPDADGIASKMVNSDNSAGFDYVVVILPSIVACHLPDVLQFGNTSSRFSNFHLNGRIAEPYNVHCIVLLEIFMLPSVFRILQLAPLLLQSRNIHRILHTGLPPHRLRQNSLGKCFPQIHPDEVLRLQAVVKQGEYFHFRKDYIRDLT